jgi:hypothetical protein
MEHKLNLEDGKRSLHDHVLSRAWEAREVYGPRIDMPRFLEFLENRRFVRYPVTLTFDTADLLEEEFARAVPLGDHPSDGFRLVIHPHFRDEPDIVPLLASYHLVTVNYGEIATREDAELFGATFLGLEVDEYYRLLCEASSRISSRPVARSPEPWA